MATDSDALRTGALRCRFVTGRTPCKAGQNTESGRDSLTFSDTETSCQNKNRTANCMILGVPAAVTCPKVAFVCAPVAGLKRAVVSSVVYWVWLKALYASARNSIRARSRYTATVFSRDRSQLLIPGPRNAVFASFHWVYLQPVERKQRASIADAINRSFALKAKTGFDELFGLLRGSVGDPVMSAPVVVVAETARGAPEMNEAMPLTCQ